MFDFQVASVRCPTALCRLYGLTAWVLVFHLGLCASFTTLRNIYIALAGSLHFQGWGALIILLRTSSGHVPITQTVEPFS